MSRPQDQGRGGSANLGGGNTLLMAGLASALLALLQEAL